MIITKKTVMGTLPLLLLGDSVLCYVTKTRLLGMTVVLMKFYFSVILPSINYGLFLWGSCHNSDLINWIDRLHCRSARIILKLSKDMASSEVMETVNWSTIKLSCEMEIFKLGYSAYQNILPDSLWGNIFRKWDNCYSLRGHKVAAIRKYKSRFTKDSFISFYFGFSMYKRLI